MQLSPFHYSFCPPCYFLCMLLLLLLLLFFGGGFSLSVTLIIAFFCCLNCTSLLLHLITKHFVSHFSLSCIIFIISTLIISIFYCLNYTSLLLHLIITDLLNIFYNNYVINIYAPGNYYNLYKCQTSLLLYVRKKKNLKKIKSVLHSLKVCVHYIFTSLLCMSKREGL